VKSNEKLAFYYYGQRANLYTHGAPSALSLRGFDVNTLDRIHDSLKITDDGKEIYWSVDKST
jgi:hypothetical protein